jgi:hypothetical protein
MRFWKRLKEIFDDVSLVTGESLLVVPRDANAEAARKILRDPSRSKRARVARGEDMSGHKTDNRKTTITAFPGCPTSPKTFCGMLLERADEIDHIACVIQWNRDADGKETTLTNIANTKMTLGQKAWMKYCFDDQFMEMDDL